MSGSAPVKATILAGLCAILVFVSGCGYTLRPPYDPTIRTVYVPVFRSLSFKNDVNLRLTEAVVKEIERRTPYRVVDNYEEADAVLSGTIEFVNKNEMLVNQNNLPRQLTTELTASVTFEDNRPTAEPSAVPPTVRVSENMPFYPELGETSSLGAQRVIHEMAKDIVSMMEEQW